MASVNKVILLGNLGKDPEIRTLNSGDKVANFSVATSETWKDKNTGEKKEKTEWTNVVVFGSLAEIVEKYLRKGSKVYLEGALQTRKWQDKDGNDRYSTEVVLKPFNGSLVMCGGGQGDVGDRSSGGYGGGQQQRGGGGGGGGYSDGAAGGSYGGANQGGQRPELDDEIPFATSDSIW